MDFNFLKNKNIFISGATGSFGQSMISKLLELDNVRRIVIFSRDELKQFELQKKFKSTKLRYFLGDIRDLERLKVAIKGIDIVIHAAALKQVPAAEYNPEEFIKTNITGAENIIKASIFNNVKKVIALSTDKATEPVNLYGATKLVSDKLFVAANNIIGEQKISFSVVRYGNVLNSRGSVLPIFFKLNEEGKKIIPITHKDMTRFFITLEQGVDYVLQFLNIMKGGEIFIPKIKSTKILALAKAINKDFKFKIIGIRPGEKIHEFLCSKADSNNIIEFDRFYIITPQIVFNKKKNYFIYSSERKKGKKVKDEFEFSSNNSETLTTKELKKIIIKLNGV